MGVQFVPSVQQILPSPRCGLVEGDRHIPALGELHLVGQTAAVERQEQNWDSLESYEQVSELESLSLLSPFLFEAPPSPPQSPQIPPVVFSLPGSQGTTVFFGYTSADTTFCHIPCPSHIPSAMGEFRRCLVVISLAPCKWYSRAFSGPRVGNPSRGAGGLIWEPHSRHPRP